MLSTQAYGQLGPINQSVNNAIAPQRLDTVSHKLASANTEIDRLFTYAQRLANLADNVDGPSPAEKTSANPEPTQSPCLVGSTEHLLRRLQTVSSFIEGHINRIESALG